jgi:hypothetical protein
MNVLVMCFLFYLGVYLLLVKCGRKPVELDQESKDAAAAKGKAIGDMAVSKWLSK